MRHLLRLRILGLSVACALSCHAGCASSSHSSVRIYEYSEEAPEQSGNDELDSEYQMQSPGEMVAPGEMVTPETAKDEP
jgi:hypothetical protein